MTIYTAKLPDQDGFIRYTKTENATWHTLINRQTKIIEERACSAFINGVHQLGMETTSIPQLPDISHTLTQLTGWSVTPVPALITAEYFFQLLSQRTFPAATFIRIPEELDYLEEPDIFHELFGHCPMITDPVFADFLQAYGEMALTCDPSHRELLARLFWFTVEFGLINTPEGPRCYGGGILSSKNETMYAVESDIPQRVAFDLLTVLRTPYRVDQIQGTYFVIDSFDQLYALLKQDLHSAINKAMALPELSLIETKHGANKDEWTTC